MERQKIFWVLITFVISILLLLIIMKVVFKSEKLNEGKFRVSDVILTSSAEVANKTSKNGVWSIDISQKNKLTFLITTANEAQIDKVYLSDITVNKGKIVFSQINNENKLNLTYEKQNLDIEYTLDEKNQMLIELVALNENILKDWTIPESTKEIIYDGRMFGTADLSLKDIQFKLKFKLNIVEKSGKINTMDVELKLPNEQLLENGADIRRLSLSDFKFKVN